MTTVEAAHPEYTCNNQDFETYSKDASTPSTSWSSDAGSEDSHMPMTPAEPDARFTQSNGKHIDNVTFNGLNMSMNKAINQKKAPMESTVKVLILGAGPTGLGAAHQLQASGSSDWLVVDSCDRPGGMAITEEDEHGFRWDLGGHVIHSHYEAFDKAIQMHTDWVHPNRGGWVRVQEQWCPTPIQQSLGNLRNGAQILKELSQSKDVEGAADPTAKSNNLAEFYRNRFGSTLNETFFAPFNRKQWGWKLDELDHTWTSLRAGSQVANVPEATQALQRLEAPKDTSSFPYPRLGTGSLWKSIAATLPIENQKYSTTVERLDIENRKAYLSTGEVVCYSRCISSIPLNHLLNLAGEQRPDLAASVPNLKHASTTAVGLGFTGELPEVLKGKSWIFSADPEVSFHRATVLTNFSKSLSNDGRSDEPRWSIMFESASSVHRPIDTDQASLVAAHLKELRRWGAVKEDEEPLSVWYKHLVMGYPLPFLGRDDLLSSTTTRILPELEKYGILSRGRFGGWRYESSNQDYAYVQGVEAVEVLTKGHPEKVYWGARPDNVDLPLLDISLQQK